MKNVRNNKSKILLSIVLILLLALCVLIKYTNQNIAAQTKGDMTASTNGKSAKEQTLNSKDRAIYQVIDWTERKDSRGDSVYQNRSATAPSLRDLLPPEQVQGDYLYITVEDLHRLDSLFCTARGTPLPGFASTGVKGGSKVTYVTDQGKQTAYLTVDDVNFATCFKTDSDFLSGWETSHTNTLSETTSKTLGRFRLDSVKQCTPAEAWIMAEFDRNISTTAHTLEFTNEEYTGPDPAGTNNLAPAASINSYAKTISSYVFNNLYTYGDMGEVPIEKDDDKKINSEGLLRWTLYAMGIKVSKGDENSIRSSGKFDDLGEVNDKNKLHPGDIVFLNNGKPVIFCTNHTVYDLGSSELIGKVQPINMEIKADNVGKAYRIKKDVEVKYTPTLATKVNNDAMEINGREVYAVGDPGKERYVAKKDNGKYYYVIINGDPEWTHNGEPQNAWWNTSLLARKNGSAGAKHTDLEDEAKAFQNYVFAVNGVDLPDYNNIDSIKAAVDKLKHNEDGTYEIDFKTDFKPENASDIDVRFNAETNKYIIGPFEVDYTRAAIKAGDRPKVSFAGVSRTVLVGADANDQELTNEDGTNRLQLGKNYRFVYDDPAVHEKNMNEFDTVDDYPYPCPGEKFYIELDYIDDMVKIKNFKMDFQFLTSGGEYEYFKGNYLVITWEPATVQVDTRIRPTNPGTLIKSKSTSVQLGKVSNRAGGGEGNTLDCTWEAGDPGKEGLNQILTGTVIKHAGGLGRSSIRMGSNMTSDFKKDTVEGVSFSVDFNGMTDTKSESDTVQYVRSDFKITDVTFDGKSVGKEGKEQIVTDVSFDKKKEVPSYKIDKNADEKTIVVKYKYKVQKQERLTQVDNEWHNSGDAYYEETSDSFTVPFDYYVSFLNQDGKMKVKSTAGYPFEIIDNKINWHGVLNAGDFTFDIDALRDGFSDNEEYTFYYSVPNSESIALGTGNIAAHAGSNTYCKIKYNGETIEKLQVSSPFGLESLGFRKGPDQTTASFDMQQDYGPQAVWVQLYNGLNKITQTSQVNPSCVFLDIHIGLDGNFYVNPTREYASEEGSFVVSYADVEEKDITLTITWQTNASYKKEDRDAVNAMIEADREERKQRAEKAKKEAEEERQRQLDLLDEEERQKREEERKKREEDSLDPVDPFDPANPTTTPTTTPTQTPTTTPTQTPTTTPTQTPTTTPTQTPTVDPDDPFGPRNPDGRHATAPVENAAYVEAHAGNKTVRTYLDGSGIVDLINTDGSFTRILADGTSIEFNADGTERTGTSRPPLPAVNPPVGTSVSEGRYQDYLVAGKADSNTAQDQSNAEGKHEVKEVDAQDGLAETPSGEPVEIEFVGEDIELTTSIGGVVWVDHERDKDGATSGHLGYADGYDAKAKEWKQNGNRENKNMDYPVEANSVEIVVWKVKYQVSSNGNGTVGVNEIERTKAIGWTEDKKEINFIEDDGRLFVDAKGNYYIPKIQVPSAEGKEDNVIYSYDVEFIYDGQTYEATEYLKPGPVATADTFTEDSFQAKLAAFKRTEEQTGEGDGKLDYDEYANSSYVIENKDERKLFDSYFTEVFGEKNASDYKQSEGAKSAMTGEKTDGYATGGRAGSYYAGQIEDTYIENPEGNTAAIEYKTEKLGEISIAPPNLEAETQGLTGEELENYYKTHTNTQNNDQMSQSILQTRRDGDFIRDQYRFAARTSTAGLLLPYETKYHVDADDPLGTNPTAYNNLTFGTTQFKPVDEYFDQINMGLLERYTTDISLVKDLYTAKIIVNNTEVTMKYNKYRALTEAHLHGRFELLPENRTYKIDLYNADYFYRSSVYNTISDTITKNIVTAVKKGTDLRMFLTYRIAMTNGSDFTNVSINEFKDYYDDSFTLVTEDIKAQVRQSQLEPLEEGDDYHASINMDNEIVTKVVATTPHYRKLSSELTDFENLYRYNWAQDKEAPGVLKQGDVTFTKLNGSEIGLNTDQQPESANGFKMVRSSSLRALNDEKNAIGDQEMMLAPGEVMEVFVTYEVDREKFYEIYEAEDGTKVARDELLGSKNNIAEITRYTTQYAEVTLPEGQHANKQRHCTVMYETGNISGRIDQDSAPDNVNIGNTETINNETNNEGIDTSRSGNTADQIVLPYYDDDTCSAPVVKINVRTPNLSRNLDGVVWDDGKAIDESLSGENLADGIYTDGEAGIDGVNVELVEKIRITADQYNNAKGDPNAAANVPTDSGTIDLSLLDYEFDFVWPDNAFGDDSSSRATTKDGGHYKFHNYAAGDYVVRFEYGNNSADENVATNYKYNGQDYKNTYYQTKLNVEKTKDGEYDVTRVTGREGLVNPSEGSDTYVPGTDDADGLYTLNNEWHNLKVEEANNKSGIRYSDARDYEPRRLQVTGYSRIISNENAETLSAYLDDAGLERVPEYYREILQADENKQEFLENTKMVANTAKFSVEIEDQELLDYQNVKTEDGEEGENPIQEYNINNIDFGLALRPETKLNIQTEINQIVLTKDDGASVVLRVFMDNEGNIITDKSQLEVYKDELSEEEYEELMRSFEEIMKDVNGFRHISDIKKSNLPVGSQGFKYVAIEQSYLNGLEVNLQYKVTVFNNSDLDYVGTRVATVKNPQELYTIATRFESGGDYQTIDYNTSPFSTGKRIVYGKYMGLHYYTGDIAETNDADYLRVKDEQGQKYLDKGYYYETTGSNGAGGTVYPNMKDVYAPDVLVTTTIDQVADYIDNDMNRYYGVAGFNEAWDDATDSDLQNKLSAVAYNGNTKDTKNLVDNKGTMYVTSGKNNIAMSKNVRITDKPSNIKYFAVDVTPEEVKKTAENNDAEVRRVIEASQPFNSGDDASNPDNAAAMNKAQAEGQEIANEINNQVVGVLQGVHNITPKLKEKTITMYKTFGDSTTTSSFDETNYVLTTETVPNRAFDEGTKQVLTGTKYQTIAGKPSFKAHIYLKTTSMGSAAKVSDMNYENLSEIMIYSNTVGRRDMKAIPGNANMIAKENVANLAGYNHYVNTVIDPTTSSGFVTAQAFFKHVADRNIAESSLGEKVSVKDGEATKAITLERDQYAARDTVTFSEPTGLSSERARMQRIVTAVLISLIIAAFAVIGITVGMVVKKTKYDDKNIIDADKN